MSDDTTLPRIGQWIRMPLDAGMLIAAGRPTNQGLHFLGYTYVDPTHGFSMKGAVEDAPYLVDRPNMGFRISPQNLNAPWRALSEDEIRERGLPAPPPWLAAYGPQSPRGSSFGAWRAHPRLQGQFHPEYPDDLQVLVHDGGPRVTKARPENIWVRVFAAHGDLMNGAILNVPHQLATVKQFDPIQFIVPEAGPPLLVRDAYLRERDDWLISPCAGCGLTELFDPPSELMRIVFPHLVGDGNEMAAFTAYCGACRSLVSVMRKGAV